MICLNAWSLSACERGIKKLFPRNRIALRYFSGSKLSPWKAPSSSNKLRLMTKMFSLGGVISSPIHSHSVRSEGSLFVLQKCFKAWPHASHFVAAASLDMTGCAKTNADRPPADRTGSGWGWDRFVRRSKDADTARPYPISSDH